MHRLGLIIGLVLVLTACAVRAPFREAAEGPVRVIVGDIGHLCLALYGQPVRGCMTRSPEGRVTIYCREGDVECLAHEVRHALEPEWHHDDAASMKTPAARR